jgi:O-antigen ligase
MWLLGGYIWLYVHRPFEVWPALGDLQIERVYMLLMLVVWLVTPGKGFVANRIHLAAAVFAGALATAWVLSPHAHAPGCYELVENYFKVAVLYLLLITVVRDEGQLRLLLLLYLGAVGVYMAHSLLEYANGRVRQTMGVSRMVGVDQTFSDPNAFAAGLLAALAMLLPFWAERPRRLPRWLLLGYGGMACLCVLLTGSRTGFLGLGALAVMGLLLSVRRKLTALALVGVGGAVSLAVLTVALPEDLQNRYLTIIDPSRGPTNAQVSMDSRWELLLLGIDAWHRSPIVGHGPGAFSYATNSELQPHNLYGQVLSEMGLMGAAALLGLVSCFAWNWLEARRHRLEAFGPDPATSLPYQVARAVGLAVVMLLLTGYAGHNLYRYHWQWFAAFQAIALHCIRVRSEAANYAKGYAILPGGYSLSAGTVS